MVPWYLRDSERLSQERKGIEELSRSVDWLVGAEWRLDETLCLDVVICAHGHDYELQLSFPALYPDAPPVVRPRNMEHRLSSHQYGGADGPLCLEWGPDNWHRDITAVQMLESAHKLLETENPLGRDRPEIPVVAASRHKLQIGQELRGELLRWYESAEFADFLKAQPEKSIGSFKFSFRRTGENWTNFIHEAAPVGGPVWRDRLVPSNLPGAEPKELDVGIWFKTDLDIKTIGKPKTLDELRVLLAPFEGTKFLAMDDSSPVEGFNRSIAGVLISDRAGASHFFLVLSKETVYKCKKVQPGRTPAQVRSPESNSLSGKTVGIVGLGSAGSKIAISLARMGLRKFYLVDHDVLLPENLQRHALDWQGVLQHKVDALVVALGRLAPESEVQVCRLDIAGQESNAAVSGALDRLAQCDLVIDATANSRVFNLLAAVVRTAGRPMIWLEIFEGGIGGLVARSRPHIDPTPQDMRGVFLHYCTENPHTAAKKPLNDYAVETEAGEVLVASDADVSIIAQHATRFALDCFVPPEQSKFPYSMYLVGLAKGWVFDAPFMTIPISMGALPGTGWSQATNSDIKSESAEFLFSLRQKSHNATTGSS